MGDTVAGIFGLVVGALIVGVSITYAFISFSGLLVCTGLIGLVIAHSGAELAFINPFGK